MAETFQKPENFPPNTPLGLSKTGPSEAKKEGRESKEADEELIKKLDDWFQESEEFMEPKRERWKKNLDLYNNNIEIDVPDGATAIKINLVLASIETQKPIISDSLPTFDIKPVGRNDLFWADVLQKAKAKFEEDAELKDAMLDTIDTSLIYSDGLTEIVPVYQDEVQAAPEEADENAEPEIRSILKGYKATDIDLFTWFPDNYGTGFELGADCRYHGFQTPMHVDEIDRIYDIETPAEGYLDKYRVWHAMDSDGKDNDKRPDSALVKEIYFVDKNIEKYPNGRRVIYVGKQKIEDEAIPYPRIPIFHIKNYGHSNYLFGIGEPELIKEIAASLDEVVSLVAENIKKMGAPQRKIKRSWYENRETDISNLADEEIIVDEQDDVQWEHLTNAVSGGTLQFIELLMRVTDIVLGTHDAIQGRDPVGVEAASAIALLQEAAGARVRYKNTKYYSKYVREIGNFVLWLMQNTDQDMINLRSELEGQYDFMKVDPTAVYDLNGNDVDSEEFDEESGMKLIDSALEVSVVTGATLPTGKLAGEQIAREKFREGIYGIEEYAFNSNEPNKQQLIDGFRKREGVQQSLQRIEALTKAIKEFERLAQKAIGSTSEFIGSIDESSMADLFIQFPEIMKEYSFTLLPTEVQDRLWAKAKKVWRKQAA